jgi:hypothetical protein
VSIDTCEEHGWPPVEERTRIAVGDRDAKRLATARPVASIESSVCT